MDEFNTSFVNVNNNNDHNLTCQVIANSCHILDDIINPEYEDTLYADDMTWILVSRVFFYLHYLFNHLYTHIYPLILYRHRHSLSLQCRVDLQCWRLVYISSPGNEVNVMLKNVCDLMFATLAFFFFGYGIAFGEPSNGFSKYLFVSTCCVL